MRILVMGLGNIGRELAIRLRADGHHVIGTTTTPEKVEALSEYVDEVAVLFGHEADKVATAGKTTAIVFSGGNVDAEAYARIQAEPN